VFWYTYAFFACVLDAESRWKMVLIASTKSRVIRNVMLYETAGTNHIIDRGWSKSLCASDDHSTESYK
jgi:hypothetical protein